MPLPRRHRLLPPRAIVDAIAIFAGKRTAGTLPDGVDARYLLGVASREYELLALDAEARYLRFRERYASIEGAIALKQVASYVGVTPEHLSRLRRRLGDSR